MTKKKILLIATLVLLSLSSLLLYLNVFSSNTKLSAKQQYIYIPTGSTYAEVLKIVAPYIKNIDQFKWVASVRSYNKHVFPGRFLFTKNMSNFGMISALRHNEPISLAFNNQETIEKLISRVSSQIEPDSTQLSNAILDTVFLKKQGFNNQTILAMFIPNTYQMKWNTSALKFRDKMAQEFKNFWNPKRLQQAQQLGLTPIQVITLAAIVHKETVKTDERPRVAGVYLNRLKIGMPLQADPTIIFALRKKANNPNLVIKRVLEGDLKINSPYNTYTNIGLPPGPVAMPDISAIDAVLRPEKHNYIYFCASVERFGYHEFAATFAEHGIWAKKYRQWVANQGINR